VEYKKKNKILITGAASTGTTFLLKLFHSMGVDSGFDAKEIKKTAKGLEWVDDNLHRMSFLHHRGKDLSPRIIKRPILHQQGSAQRTFIDHAQSWGWEIDHIIFCTREWENRMVREREMRMAKNHMRPSEEEDFVAQQRNVLYQFYKMMWQITEQEIPFTMISFPRSVRDADYTWRCLEPVLKAESLAERERFNEAFKTTAEIGLVHEG